MSDLLHCIRVSAKPDAVLNAITTQDGLQSWWTADCDADNTIGNVNIFRFGAHTEFHFRIDESSGNRVHWTCLAAPKVPEEWVGTTVTFDLLPNDDGTRIEFAHRGWKRTDGEFPICNTTWGELMHRIKDLVEGNPRGPYFT